MVSELSTAAVADACVRLGLRVRAAPSAIAPVVPGNRFSGPALPVTHLGSVDVFLEIINDAHGGEVLVVDNGGRLDEACIGDLITLEAKVAGLSAIVIWGYHRDTRQLRSIGLPVHSLGAFPTGPQRVPPVGPSMLSARLDGVAVTEEDHVIGDDDGVLFLGPDRRSEVIELALSIQAVEHHQAEQLALGVSLREQLDFATYKHRQAIDPTYTLRDHLRAYGGAIET